LAIVEKLDFGADFLLQIMAGWGIMTQYWKHTKERLTFYG
jgi:hypothetical protein